MAAKSLPGSVARPFARGDRRLAESHMTDTSHAAGRRLAGTVLTSRAGPSPDATATATAASDAYHDLTRVLAPVIGDLGVAAMTNRAMHLAVRGYPWLPARQPGAADTPFAQFIDALKRQEPAVATDAATAVFEAMLGLLATFIGEPLTARLVQQAWPDAFSSTDTEGT